ncbi:hypothetical protein ScPMuIL_013713 [Solemya velum]
MKSNSMFREQVKSVTSWFSTWSECEQTVALYSLLKRISPSQGCFLVQVLQNTLLDCQELKITEEEANNSVYISNLGKEPVERAVQELLAHLPLLHSGNITAKSEYLKIIPKVLSHSIENGVYIEECRQLLSYSLIHPAITSEERSQFTMWLGHLEERFTYSIYHNSQQSPDNSNQENTAPTGQKLTRNLNVPCGKWIPNANGNSVHSNGINSQLVNSVIMSSTGSTVTKNSDNINGGFANNSHLPLQATFSAPPNVNPVPQGGQAQGSPNQLNDHIPLRRTASATPFNLQLAANVSEWMDKNDLHMSKSNSQNNILEHAPLSPQSSVSSSGSGSDTVHDDRPRPIRNTFLEEDSGMRDVPMWLKSLRLHKYAYLFQQFTNDEMLNISETWLESQKVTKGARHKIILSITKLKERQSRLRSLEKEIMEGGSLKAALSEMKSILGTPIKRMTPPVGLTAGSGDVGQNLSPPPSPSEGDAMSIPEGDIPGQFQRLMGKVCTQLLVSSRPDEECFNIYLLLIDKCISHEAFSQKQKKLLSTWKQQAQRMNPNPKFYAGKNKGSWGNTFPVGMSFGRGNPSRVARIPKPVSSQWSFGAKRSVLGVAGGHIPLQKNNSMTASMFAARSNLIEVKRPLTRTQSAPLRSGPFGLTLPNVGDGVLSTDTEINAQLDSLCLSMTEHALGGSDGNDKSSVF